MALPFDEIAPIHACKSLSTSVRSGNVWSGLPYVDSTIKVSQSLGFAMPAVTVPYGL